MILMGNEEKVEISKYVTDRKKIVSDRINDFDSTIKLYEHIDMFNKDTNTILGKTSLTQNGILNYEISYIYDLLEILIKEIKNIYSIISKDTNKIEKIVKDTELFKDKRIIWLAEELHRKLIETEKEFDKSGGINE